jgi:hypothetical protein
MPRSVTTWPSRLVTLSPNTTRAPPTGLRPLSRMTPWTVPSGVSAAARSSVGSPKAPLAGPPARSKATRPSGRVRRLRGLERAVSNDEVPVVPSAGKAGTPAPRIESGLLSAGWGGGVMEEVLSGPSCPSMGRGPTVFWMVMVRSSHTKLARSARVRNPARTTTMDA